MATPKLDVGDRIFYKALPVTVGAWPGDNVEEVMLRTSADLVSSEKYQILNTGTHWHMPAIDIDFPVQLVPSSTEGHFHLYLDKEMSWHDYLYLLQAMQHVGLVEKGFVDSAIRRGRTQLRLPEKPKSGHAPDHPLFRAESAEAAEEAAAE